MVDARLKWVLSKDGPEEHVTFVAFVKKFQLNDKQSATDAYLSLISSSRIRQSRQEKLRAAFASFQKNHEEDFWANRALQLNSQITSKKAGVFIQDVGLRQAESAYIHCSSKININAVPIKPTSDLKGGEKRGVVEDDAEEVELSSSPVTPSDAISATDTADSSERQIPTKKRKLKQQGLSNEDVYEETIASTEEYHYCLEEFKTMVESLDRQHFWRLECSGRYVEDVLIEAARAYRVQQISSHAKDEWSEICCTNWKARPVPSQSILNYLETFNKGTLEELHTAADSHLPISGPYRHEEHWVFRWIRITVETWLGLYCQIPAPLKSRQQESFYRNDVFGMINSLLRDVKDLVVVHGELTSVDTAERRNRDRTLPTDGALERKRMGYRCDGLVQVVQGQPPLNIGVLEASKVFDNTGNKFLFDTCKVTRELHDMLRNRLKSLHVLTKSTELILVGYVLSGMFY